MRTRITEKRYFIERGYEAGLIPEGVESVIVDYDYDTQFPISIKFIQKINPPLRKEGESSQIYELRMNEYLDKEEERLGLKKDEEYQGTSRINRCLREEAERLDKINDRLSMKEGVQIINALEKALEK